MNKRYRYLRMVLISIACMAITTTAFSEKINFRQLTKEIILSLSKSELGFIETESLISTYLAECETRYSKSHKLCIRGIDYLIDLKRKQSKIDEVEEHLIEKSHLIQCTPSVPFSADNYRKCDSMYFELKNFYEGKEDKQIEYETVVVSEIQKLKDYNRTFDSPDSYGFVVVEKMVNLANDYNKKGRKKDYIDTLIEILDYSEGHKHKATLVQRDELFLKLSQHYLSNNQLDKSFEFLEKASSGIKRLESEIGTKLKDGIAINLKKVQVYSAKVQFYEKKKDLMNMEKYEVLVLESTKILKDLLPDWPNVSDFEITNAINLELLNSL